VIQQALITEGSAISPKLSLWIGKSLTALKLSDAVADQAMVPS